jgi:hypothetical protein
MAIRVLSQMMVVNSAGPDPPRWYGLMTDGSIWKFSQGTWIQAPALPGARTASSIQIVPDTVDKVYAATTDGTIWAAQVTAPFTWTQVATTP